MGMSDQANIKSYEKASSRINNSPFQCAMGLRTRFSDAEQEIINLSKDKWQWMSEKNVDAQLIEVGGHEVTHPFAVTEVSLHQNGSWKLCSLSFTRLMTPDNRQEIP
jgi:hypothetical protein